MKELYSCRLRIKMIRKQKKKLETLKKSCAKTFMVHHQVQHRATCRTQHCVGDDSYVEHPLPAWCNPSRRSGGTPCILVPTEKIVDCWRDASRLAAIEFVHPHHIERSAWQQKQKCDYTNAPNQKNKAAMFGKKTCMIVS